MKRKSVLPLAGVLGIAGVWTMLTQGGGIPVIKVDGHPMAQGSRTSTTVTVQSERPPLMSVSETREEELQVLLKGKDTDVARYARVHSIRCDERTCRIEASPKGDPELFRSHMNKVLGSYQKPDDSIALQVLEAGPGVTRFVIVFDGALQRDSIFQ